MNIPSNKIIDDAFNCCCEYFHLSKQEMLIEMIKIQSEKMIEVEKDKKKITELLNDLKFKEE